MEQQLSTIIYELYGLNTHVGVSRPDPQFGDYASNVALQIAKQVGKPPRDIAAEISAKLQETGEYIVEVAGPGFINISVSAQSLADRLDREWSETYGENSDGAGKTVVVEYPSPNMAKPYSIGHLRPANQGWAARRLMEATGWKVITDNHLGDYGAPFGVWVVGFLKYSNDEALARDGVYELGRVYIAMKKELKEEAARGESDLASQVQAWLQRLEAGDAEAVAYSQRFNAISLEHLHRVMERMHISTEFEYGEAFFAPKGKAAVQKLLDDGLAIRNDDGSVVMPLDGFDVPLLIEKSNGTALYATTDIATLLFRHETWNPDKIIHAVGSEQQFYFRQLFAAAKKLGVQAEMVHLWFGMIDQLNDDGTREKMSSRKGVVLMEELLDMAEAKAREAVKGDDIPDEDIKKIALGAIKFTDFAADRRTNILFNWDTIFALTGYSGPYVQYAAVRVNKILQDNGAAGGDGMVSGYDYIPEKPVLLHLLEYPSLVRESADALEPHRIAQYVHDLARVMNRYYETTPIATGDVSDVEKSARLGLLGRVSHVFTHGLGLLGIEVPSRM